MLTALSDLCDYTEEVFWDWTLKGGRHEQLE